ncbi:molybdopterin-dependent oxidoreductase [Trinickia fusca]|uniref:Oxidoreductase n=1 Tax=Trinickia fusca TaxID=2419777 RepID=A0A494XNL5_9BURK|nr:molybdopterin-dependent oxidoreductase [Trinickia fusca]RKP52240.1 oxidoreductase [Trinickia fusca]
MGYPRTSARLAGRLVLLLLLTLTAVAVRAESFTLTVSGNIGQFTDEQKHVYVLTEKDLLAMPQYTIDTSTSWTKKAQFAGPRLSDVLKRVGARGNALEFHSLDDYAYTIPADDATRYGVILARTMNGKPLQVKDFGPLFLIYPRDRYPDELRTPVAEAKFIWQVTKIVVK